MKNMGTIARAIFALSLSTAVLAGCGDNSSNDGGPGVGTNIVALPNSAMCNQALPSSGFDRYREGNFRQYRMQSHVASEEGRGSHRSRTDFGYNPNYGGSGYGGGGYGGGYGPGAPGYGGLNGGSPFSNGFQGCPIGFIPACSTMAGAGGLTCVPAQNLPIQNVAGYNYGPGSFAYAGPGLNSCNGFGGGGFGCYQQIAQTCVIGMPNGCMQGACYPVGNGVGVCAIQ